MVITDIIKVYFILQISKIFLYPSLLTNMIQMKIPYIIFLVLGTSLLISGITQFSFSLTNPDSDGTIKTNSLNFSEHIYQALSGKFLAAKDIATKPLKVAEESFFEEGVMKSVGNVTNNMTFTNTYLPRSIIQAKGNGTIKAQDGQAIDWISSDIGIINTKGITFHGIILFNNTNTEKFAFLNNTVGVYKETPGIKRTIWLMK